MSIFIRLEALVGARLSVGIIAVLAVGIVGCARDVRVSQGCASAAMPQGWRQDPKVPLGVLMTVRSPDKHRFGGLEVEDILRVEVLPADGMTLSELKDKLSRITLAELQQHIKEEFKPGLTVPDLRPPVVTSMSVGSTPAVQAVVDTVLTMEGEPVAARTVTVTALVGGHFYRAAGAYPIAREQQMKPVVDRFLASFRLEGCGTL